MAEFDPPPVPARFAMDQVAAGQVCLPANQFSPVSTIPSLQSYLNAVTNSTVSLERRQISTTKQWTEVASTRTNVVLIGSCGTYIGQTGGKFNYHEQKCSFLLYLALYCHFY